jgi:hypothetical protein
MHSHFPLKLLRTFLPDLSSNRPSHLPNLREKAVVKAITVQQLLDSFMVLRRELYDHLSKLREKAISGAPPRRQSVDD